MCCSVSQCVAVCCSVLQCVDTETWTRDELDTSVSSLQSDVSMGWLWSVGSIQLQVTFAEYRLFYRALLQKRPIISSILLNKTTPYTHPCHHFSLTKCVLCVYPVRHICVYPLRHICVLFVYPLRHICTHLTHDFSEMYPTHFVRCFITWVVSHSLWWLSPIYLTKWDTEADTSLSSLQRHVSNSVSTQLDTFVFSVSTQLDTSVLISLITSVRCI